MSDERSAGIVSRAIAAVIDAVVVVTVLGVGYLATSFIIFTRDVTDFVFPQIGLWFTTTGFLVTSVLYLMVCWSMSGRTVGNVLMGLRVIRANGEPLHFAQIGPRAVLCVVFPVGLFWVALSSKRLSLQDALLRTRVVYARE
ncbi:MAG: RDD family protein [Gordonia sp. (in: high G+C Gram-positive bacteria)]|uniref:RDD family protein n=1 Tax=Gordonia TaxID=2053 RepID=UPI00326560A5